MKRGIKKKEMNVKDKVRGDWMEYVEKEEEKTRETQWNTTERGGEYRRIIGKRG